MTTPTETDKDKVTTAAQQPLREGAVTRSMSDLSQQDDESTARRQSVGDASVNTRDKTVGKFATDTKVTVTGTTVTKPEQGKAAAAGKSTTTEAPSTSEETKPGKKPTTSTPAENKNSAVNIFEQKLVLPVESEEDMFVMEGETNNLLWDGEGGYSRMAFRHASLYLDEENAEC
jgi:hypothetical protein